MSEIRVESILAAQRESGVQRVGRVAGKVLRPTMAIALAIVAWWLVGDYVFGWDTVAVPSPSEVWVELVNSSDRLPHHTWVTLYETLVGYGIAIVIGIPIAALIASSKFFEETVYPVLVGFNAIPKIAIAPILIIWLGFGAGPKVAMVLLVCFFPIVISTATGLKSAQPELLELSRSLSASQAQQFVKVRFPAALPHIFVGLKVAITLAVIGAVVGEFVGATEGLGYVIVASGQTANTPLAFAAIVVLSVMSIVLFYAIVLIEKIVVPWSEQQS